jgi:hypothetical protein
MPICKQRREDVGQIPGVHKALKQLKKGLVHYHYTHKGGPRFWKGRGDDGDHTPGYRAAYDLVKDPPPPPPEPGKETVRDLSAMWTKSREWNELSDRTRADYERGLDDLLSKFGDWPALPFLNDPDAGNIVLSWIEDCKWSGRAADYRLDSAKALASWAAVRHKSSYPRSQFHGIKKFYRGGNRSSIVWKDEEVDAAVTHFHKIGRPVLADAVILGRDIGGRIGDLVELGPQHAHKRKDGRTALVFHTQKGQRYGRVANVLLSERGAEIVWRCPPDRETFLLTARGAHKWDKKDLAKEVMESLRAKKVIRSAVRFNDLRGTRATELAWDPDVSIAELALQMGWNQETAARMLGVYSANNPDAIRAK